MQFPLPLMEFELSFQYILIVLQQITISMDPLQQKSSNQHSKSYLHDTSSTISSRFTRRQDQRLSNRKSIPRTSSEQSLSKMNLSNFYVKIHPSQNSSAQSPPRKNIMNRPQQPVTPKRRSPTPQPGHSSKPNKQRSANCLQQIQTDLLIAQLQQKYGLEKDTKEILQKQIGTFQKQLNLQHNKIKQLQKLYCESRQREQASKSKLEQYQSMMAVTENSLHEARNNLQRLKTTIKQNKYAQIQSDNTRLKNQNKSLRHTLELMHLQTNTKNTHISNLENQILLLQSLNDNLRKQSRIQQKNREIEQLHKIIQESKNQKEEKLEQCLALMVQQNQNLKVKVDKLQIRLNFLLRKKNGELQLMREGKNELITKLRKKISHIYTKYNTLCTQHDKLKAKNLFCSIKIQRKNMMLQDISNDRALFDLTPQK